MLAAVSNKGIIVKYASKRLRGDKDVAMAAIKQNKKADIFLTDEIRKDEEVDAFYILKKRKTKTHFVRKIV